MAGGGQSWSNFTDSLMVHTVDAENVVAGKLCQQGAGCHGNRMRGNRIIKRLRVGNREILRELTGKILINAAAQSDIQKLDSAADAKERLLGIHDKLEKSQLHVIPFE